MSRTRTVLAWPLALLFLGLSFNAYACFIPLFAQSPAAMEAGCPAPDDQPVRQFCDAFKTLSIQAPIEQGLSPSTAALSSADSLRSAALQSMAVSWLPASTRSAPHRDKDVVTIKVLRI